MEELRSWLISAVARLVEVDAGAIDARERFSRHGLDSMGAARLLAELGAKLGRPLPPTLVWDHPTIEALARHLSRPGDEPRAPAGAPQAARKDEPVAVVGLACRFPKAPSLEAFWRLLRDGVDAITEVPRDRWDLSAVYDEDQGAPGKMSTRWGGFLDQVDGFDAPFFGVSPREATSMDPQQRLMLELSWEALEDAGVGPLSLKGSSTGVFFGAMWIDYARLTWDDHAQIVQHTATGQDLSVVPARVSYTLGLSGPSLQVNTACSSSLVAVHLACQSLRSGESRLALVGGVNLILAPESTIAMSKFGAMSPDGRSKAFDARANGYVRGEGGGVAALKLLSDALADGDRIYCVIRGSAVNNDGFSNGLTAPNPRAQEAVLRDACIAAGVAPAEVQYVEAHGTGTMLGDPIEAGALGAVMGVGRPAERPLRIGSVKTNIGHLEAAAGIAGLIKVALSMHHRTLPPSLHYQRPNPHIAFEALRLQVQASLAPWDDEDGRLLAGVSSFGFGGTNAHVVLESSPAGQPRLFTLSAATEQELRAAARHLAGRLRTADGPSLEEACEVGARGETAAARIAAAVRSRRELGQHLEAYVQGQALPGLAAAVTERRPRVAFMFGGQGSQWQGMGRALVAEPAARAILEQCDRALRAHAPWSLLERLTQGGAPLFDQTDFVQPAIFAMQVALAAAWRARGVEPDAVVGQSMGEVAAAFVAGSLSLDDAARIICKRSRLAAEVAGGGMAVVGLSLAATSEALSPYAERLSVAVSSGPETTVVAGDEAALRVLLEELQRRGVFCRPVRVDYASHSSAVDPVLPELGRALSGIAPRRGRIAFYSTSLGAPVDGAALGEAYWVRNLREPVLFAPVVQRMAQEGFEVFVEQDPHPVLVKAVEQCLSHGGHRGIALASARRDEPEPGTLLDAAARLFVAGVPVRERPEEGASAQLLVLSATTAAALDAQASRLRDHLTAHPEQRLADVALSLATTRSAMEHRLAFTATTREEIPAALEEAAQGRTPPGASRHAAPSSPGKLAFLFTGQGAQVPGMGRGLYQAWPSFREAFDQCAALFDRELTEPLRDVMWAERGSGKATLLDQTGYTQPALFALEYALAALWRSWGVEPEMVAGHSIGELTAAFLAGVFSLEDAVRLVAARGRLMQALPAGGAMSSIAAAEADVAAAVAAHADAASIAAVNGPEQVVISGVAARVQAITASFAARGVRTKALRVSHAFHSPLMEPMLEAFERVAESVTYRRPTIGLVSNLSGELSPDEIATPSYWVRHVREAVRFADGVKSLHEAGAGTFVEVGPKPTLLGLVPSCLPEARSTLVASSRPERGETTSALDALGGVWASGAQVAWSGVFLGGGRRVPLPSYPWQRQRCWVELPDAAATRAGEATGHPLLGARVPAAQSRAVFEAVLGLRAQAWLGDHRVGDHVLMPGAALAEMLWAAAARGAAVAPHVTELLLKAPLVLPEAGARRVHVVLSDAGTAAVFSQPAQSKPDAAWTQHAGATLVIPPSAAVLPAALDLAVVQDRCAELVDLGATYARFEAMGLAYGPALRAMQSLRRGRDEALAALALPAGTTSEGFGLSPVLLDAAFQAVLAAAESEDLLLPFAVGDLAVHVPGAVPAWVHVRLRREATGVTADLTLADAVGAVVAEVTALRLQRADHAALRRARADASSDGFFRLEWLDAPRPGAPAERPEQLWVVVAAPGSTSAAALAARLGRCVMTEPPGLRAALAGRSAGASVVCLWEVGAEEDAPAAAQRLACEGLAVVQALRGHAAARLWWVTTHAVAAVPGEPVTVATAPVWGLGRTVMQEQPELGCTLVDLEPGVEAIEALVQELSASDDESQVARRGGRRLVARLVRASAPTPEAQASIPTQGTVLVTGGLGALGLHVARWLAGQGVPHLVLTGRRGMDTPGAVEVVEGLRALGARLTVAAVDVADREALGAVLRAIPEQWPLRGVVHAAGVLDDGVLADQTAERFARVLSPKVKGAWNLHALTAGHELGFFVLFSSVSGLLGAAGQSNYTAANAFLDALAAHRRAQGSPAQSLAWGSWSEVGMAAGMAAAQQARLARTGMTALAPAEGVALFEQALARPEAQLAVVRYDLAEVDRSFGATVPPVWRALLRRRSAAGARGSLAARLATLPQERRVEEVRALVQAEVGRVLSLRDVPIDRPLRDLGLDSLMAVELRNALGQRVGATLPATLAFDHPTVEAQARWLLAEVLAAAPQHAPALQAPRRTTLDEPIAILGFGCRFPGGVTGPGALWRLLDQGVDAITEVPPERWDVDALHDPDPGAPGKMITRCGGFLSDIDQFEPSFFGISSREAADMDPQQRLLLETSWEALERSGIVPERLLDSDTGVFVGLMYQDYRTLFRDPASLDGYVVTGTMGSVASGRLSYALGLKGPSMTVDTACSSSLVTVHLACQALRQGECSAALAGGVTLMLTPDTFVEFSRLRGMAPDGRCKSFSAAADGVAWSEGCGVLVLKRLSDAQRDGDPILAVIRGSAVNQDGRSNGLTAPNGPSQEEVIRKALARAGVAPSDVGYVEAHGTGTTLGDPIEARAMGAVFSEGRTLDRPVLIGSVKSNLGHTQAAAGVAGIIKVVLAMQHGRIPRSLHFDAPSPHIPWAELPVKVAAEPVDWPSNGAPRRAGVSAFGISGTNAHVVLEEAPGPKLVSAPPERTSEIFVLSAKTTGALEMEAARLHEHLRDHPEQGLGDVAFSLATTRSRMDQRLAVVASSRDELMAALEGAAQGQVPAGVVRGASSPGKLAFLFTGQGAQVPGMGRGLDEAWPAFREAFGQCAALFDRELAEPLRDVVWAEPGSDKAGLLDQTGYTQPALFALEYALAALWRSWGVEPEMVAGHSVGELTAACVAGVFSLEDAVRLVAARGRLMQALPAGGAMVSIAAAEADVAAAVAAHADAVSIAAVNGPEQVVISGVAERVQAIAASFAARGVRAGALRVSHAFHSPLMEPMLEAFEQVAASVTYRRPAMGLVSNLSGELSADEVSTPSYWVRHAREAVRFADGVKSLHEAGAGSFVEVGPKPTLLGLAAECLPDATPSLQASLRAGREAAVSVLEALGGVWAAGGRVDWAGVFPAGGRRVELPTYPWQRQRCWIEARANRPATDSRSVHAGDHPLLGQVLTLSTDSCTRVWETTLDTKRLPWLDDHRVQGAVVLPGAAYLEMGLASGAAVFGGARFSIDEVSFSNVLAFAGDTAVAVQVVTTDDQPGRLRYQVASRAPGDGPVSWRVHARGTLRKTEPTEGPARLDLAALQAQLGGGRRLKGPDHYADMERLGLSYGARFRGVEQVWVGDGEALGRVRLSLGDARAYKVHPALLDACLQVVTAVVPERLAGRTMVPVLLSRVVLHRPPPEDVWVHVRRHGDRFDFTVSGADGHMLIELRGLRLEALPGGVDPFADCVFAVAWRPMELAARAPAARGAAPWLVVRDERGTGAALSEALRARGETCVEIDPGAGLERALSERIGAWSACRGVVCCASLDAAPFEATTPSTLEADLRRGVLVATRLAQAILRRGFRDPPRLFLVTRGAQSVEAEAVTVAQAPLWGLGRTLALEHPELECTRVDLPATGLPDEVEVLAREILSGDAEDQVAIRASGRFVARLARSTLDAEVQGPERALAAGRPCRLEIREPGVLERLSLREMDRRSPGPGELEIEVEAAGLNFLDVMKTMGVYPGLPPGPAALGGECAGRVIAVGSGVSGALLGREVVAWASGAIASHVTVPAAFVVDKPSSMSFEQAAAILVVFATAHWSLHHVARLSRGERVLIHSASGGTGLAAIQCARRVGAEVFATAGTEEKRSWLRSMGVEHVMDSRSLAFADEIMARTGGRGVDVVLNSLVGEALVRSLEVLAPHGRFVEIGKKDIYGDTRIGLLPFRKGLSYTAVDMATTAAEAPDRLASLLREVMALFADGSFAPLPTAVFAAGDAEAAFRQMAQAKHTGKIAIRMKDPEARVAPRAAQGATITGDKSYLITGGLGGLGLTLARWMVERGARHLALVGRSAPADAARAAIVAMEAAGAEVRVLNGDVSRAADVVRITAELRDRMPPLRGVVHAAAVLADRTLLELGEEQLWAPIRPKVLGAWNLHAATRALPLDFFVMYSSVASLLGSPGQAAYAAGNAFLDALAHARVALGLPAVSVQWGPFAEVGLAAARGNRGERLSSQGLESFAPHEGNELLARVLERPRAEVGLLRVSLRRWFESNPQASGMRFLAELEGEHAQPREVEGGRLRATLERAPAAERASLIEGHVLEQLGRVLRASPSRIDRRAPFVSLGVDSLTSLELRNRLEASLGMRLPAALLFTYATPAGLAEHLADVLVPAGPAPPAGGEPEAPRPSSSDLGDLGVSELLAALDDELLLARKVETPR